MIGSAIKKFEKNPKKVDKLMLRYIITARGGSRIFSNGADFQKNVKNFDDLFFRSPKLISAFS